MMSDSSVTGIMQKAPMSTLEVEKSWHLFAILLSIGRPASVEELASKCQLFSAPPDFVRYLCSIANSPLYLVENGLVMVSTAAITVVGEFLSKVVIGCDFLRCGIRVSEGNRLWDSNVRTYHQKRKISVLDAVISSAAKRRLSSPFGNGERGLPLSMPNSILVNFAEEAVDTGNLMFRNMSSLTVDFSDAKVYTEYSNEKGAQVPLLLDYAECASLPLTIVGPTEAEYAVQTNEILNKDMPRSVDSSEHHECLVKVETNLDDGKPVGGGVMHINRFVASNLDLNLDPPSSLMDPMSCKEIAIDTIRFENKECYRSALWLNMPHNATPLDGISDSNLSKVPKRKSNKAEETILEVIEKGDFTDVIKAEIDSLMQSNNHVVTDEAERNSMVLGIPMTITNLKNNGRFSEEESFVPLLLVKNSNNQKQPANSSRKLNGAQDNHLFPKQVRLESLDYYKNVNSPKQSDQCKNSQKLISKEQKLKKSRNENMMPKESNMDTTPISPKNQLENKALPNIESFVIEEEEGSGGYGTVYRARRNNDGRKFAIKCPHINAHKHNVINELKMLERFGGRNFIIKYEGSFKSGSSECFILEHVEHDRPEVLKKEIDIFQLQWYGYCMFKALAFLHKQGVMHRDVKPGNFLFSRKRSKGFLIDFNLAMDLQQKCSIAGKLKSSHNTSFDHIPITHSKCVPSTKDSKLLRVKSGVGNLGASVNSKQTQEHDKNMNKRVQAGCLKNYPDLSGGTVHRSQGADGSGITSTKDATNARNPSAGRMREPLPCQGRKELISLVQNAMQSPNHVAKNPVSRRKRIAAPLKVDKGIVYPTPMPLRYGHVSVAGIGSLKSKGKREGSCAGTKGFRAPEVLFRSLHQGLKVDIWSAGVSLLYLMVGRTPFTGDPEENLRDIARLRGSEDLWEVAKLHDRDSSFPVELLDINSTQSMDLESWCKTHTKRPEFLKLIPRSLFDLVDKCLTVNPRLRISAEEALSHEFFAPCHESLRKQKILKRGLSLDSGSVQNDFAHG